MPYPSYAIIVPNGHFVLASVAFAMPGSSMGDHPKPRRLAKGASANEVIADLGDCDSCLSIPMELIDLDPLAKEGDEFRAKITLRSARIGMLHRKDSQVDLAARASAKYRPSSAGTS
ncbi:hypothetical protein ACEPAH_3816 [Sanghuangporus vaninii]